MYRLSLKFLGELGVVLQGEGLDVLLLGARAEQRLGVTQGDISQAGHPVVPSGHPNGHSHILTSYPPSLRMTVTSMGWLTMPTTERTRDMKSSGNQMMPTRKRMMRPPMPYFTTFFFFCPLGWGYFWRGGRQHTV